VPLVCPANGVGAITVEFWNYVDESSNSVAFSFADGQATTADRVACHAPWGDGTIYWDCGGTDDKGRVSASYSAYVKKWTHIALVSNGAKSPGYQAIYINGKLVGDKQPSKGPTRSFTTLLIGAELSEKPNDKKTFDKTLFHKGKIDQFRVWNRVRTQKEIKRGMYAELIGDEPGLVACFNFNWGIADKEVSWLTGNAWKNLPNSVPNASDGTLFGFAATDYTESDVLTKAPVGPVFRLTKDDAAYYTASYAEKKKKTDEGWVEDSSPAFYAHRAPALGTTPLYRLQNTQKTAYRLTASRAERDALDPRTHKSQTAGEWSYDGEIGYVSATKNGNAVPLYENYPRYTTLPTLCYVLPSIDATYEPMPISFAKNGLSEHLWYAIVCRSQNEKWGLMLEDDGKDTKPRLAAIPETGDYAEFQWRITGSQIVNRAYPNATLKVTSDWVPVKNKGTDCFSLVQDGKPLLGKAEWTLLATELRAGYTIPGPPATHCGLPYSKYLSATDGKATIHMLGTGTVSDWAMLRSKLIIENMIRALKPDAVDTKPLDGVEVLVISKDDSNQELDDAACIGYLHTEQQIEETRGGAHGHACYVTEEMMWKDNVFNGKQDKPWFRQFDQLVHEFGHVLDQQTTAIDSNTIVIGTTPAGLDADTTKAADAAKGSQKAMNDPSELYAMSVQSWFNSITKTDWSYYPETREKLKRVDLDRYNFMAKHFDEANTWMPPIEFRKEPSHPTSTLLDDDTVTDDAAVAAAQAMGVTKG
jgi:hypothetical protein